MYNYKMINEKFTAKVAEYMAKGYAINTASARGSQGEIAKVDLTDGENVYRIMLDDTSEKVERYHYLNCLKIVVGVFRGVKGHEAGYSTLWNEKMEVLESESFFKMGYSRVYHGDAYGNAGEAQARLDKMVERDSEWSDPCHSNRKDITSEAVLEIIIPMVKRKTGLSRVRKDLVKVEHDNEYGYIVTYNYNQI